MGKEFPYNWYQGSRIEAPTWNDVDDQIGPVDCWGDSLGDEVHDDQFTDFERQYDYTVGREHRARYGVSLTDWERTVTKIAEQHGLVYERPKGGRNHGKLRDPITGKFRPVSCSPREEGRAAIHVNNDARRLVAARVTTNGHVTLEEIREAEEAIGQSVSPADTYTSEVLTDCPDVPDQGVTTVTPKRTIRTKKVVKKVRRKRTISTRRHDERPRKALLAELARVVAEIDQLEQWQKERRAEADALVAKGRRMGITHASMAEVANRSVPWIQTCMRRVNGVERNQPYNTKEKK